MQVDIRPLEPALLEDYLRFFDDVAFADHKEWAWCYCTFYHLGKEDEERLEAEFAGNWTRDALRGIAVGLIQKRALNGYLAYENGQVVGWCNAADKKNYKKLCENRSIWDDGEDLPVKAVTCFIIAPGMRRRGVAAALLERAAIDAAAEGYAYLEAYPASGELDCYKHYHGHPAMYEKCGFTPHKKLDGYSVYRKRL